MSNQHIATTARRVSRQREAGEVTRRETRRLLLVAAKEEFAERGYSAATVARIAQRADVAVQTLYSAWGSKRALLRAVMETSVSGKDDVMLDHDGPARDMMAGVPAGLTSVELLTHLSHEFRVLAERAAVGWQTYRDAAAVDPEAAQDWQQLMEIRRRSFRRMTGLVPKKSLRKGLTPEMAADTAWVIASPDTHDQLIRRAGYTYDEFEDWVRRTLIATLLA